MMRSRPEEFLNARSIIGFFLLSISKSFLVTPNTADSCMNFQTFTLFNKWSKEERCSLINDNFPALSGKQDNFYNWKALSVAPYQRGPGMSSVPGWQQDNQWRFLLTGVGNSFDHSSFSNSTWVYDPFINSWTRLPLRAQPDRRYYSLNTWCNTSVILFGGSDEWLGTRFNDTWLFDGVTETWKKQEVKLWRTAEFVQPRYWHSAVIIEQPLSNCTCQQSLLVYGGSHDGLSCMGDLWEMRCIADSNRIQQFYWISLSRVDDALWPPNRRLHTASDFNKRSMYMWGGLECPGDTWIPLEDVWEYDLTSVTWKHHKRVTNRLPQTCMFLYDGLSFFYSRWDGIIAFNGNCTYILKSQSENLTFDVLSKDTGETKTCATDGENIFCFAIGHQATTVLRLIGDNAEPTDWQWTSMPSIKAHTAVSLASYHFVGTAFYVEKNIDVNARYVPFEKGIDTAVALSLWQFDLRIKSWSQTWHPFAPLWQPGTTYSTMNDFVLVRYYPYEWWSSVSVTKYLDIDNNTGSLWLFDTTIRRWTLCLEVSGQPRLPTARKNSAMAGLGNGSLLMFSGRGDEGDIDDLWRVDLCDQREYLPLKQNCVRWVQLTRDDCDCDFPAPRHYHSAFLYEGSMFVFGGIRITSHNWTDPVDRSFHKLNDMWKFDVERLKWKQVEQKGLTSPFDQCMSFVGWTFARWGTKFVVQPLGPCLRRDVWTFDLNLSGWSLQAMAPGLRASVLAFWDGKLVLVGQLLDEYRPSWDLFSFLNPSCPKGQRSRHWESESCKICPKGSYAALGDQNCSSCPTGLTTRSTGSSSSRDCVCRDDYCEHGECVTAVGGKAVCQCQVGYTGSTCRYPTYFLMGAAVLGVSLLISFSVICTRRMVQYRRAKTSVENELASAHRVWNIHCTETDLKERIDGETPGTYGEVYRGIYRDMTVAVKHLNEMMFSDQTIKEDFEREVEVMRGIRHPNIVMFFGAGEVEREERGKKISYPFLVLEFMKRGTLKKVLDSSDISLSYQYKVGFALDAARGMRYLHTLSPTRIHRDMKSANLLVSQSWVVKVSDFGSARMVKREGERQATVSRTHTVGMNKRTPLLSVDKLMTNDTGTVLWRPPEIFALENYGTSADVYSYGIVLWEILCRELPYKDHKFSWIEDVSHAVQRGIRPAIPTWAPTVYVQLMKDCWHGDPDLRPSFAHIVDRLVAMADSMSVQPEYEGERDYISDVAREDTTVL